MIFRSFRKTNRACIRAFSSTAARRELRDVTLLPDRIIPKYKESKGSDLLSLQWPTPPRNVLIVKKDCAPEINEAVIEYAKHINSNYENVSLIFEPRVGSEVENLLPFPIYTTSTPEHFLSKVDMTTTLGGDGTILHASSLFSTSLHVPPILSFSMGTLGFLSEWKFAEYKRAFREVYMSGAEAGSPLVQDQKHPHVATSTDDGNGGSITGWSSIRGKSMGPRRSSKILLRNRLNVGIYDADGNRVNGAAKGAEPLGDAHAMNEVIIHRGKEAHLVYIQVFVGGRFLTEAVADGMIVATPTGSTAYSLSSGGSIVHPLVDSLLLTPVCPRSLSFRPLVLPANAPITLRLSEQNRGAEMEVSIDGKRRSQGVFIGMEVRVNGERITKGPTWSGGVPCIMRGRKGGDDDDGWVGGLNGLLKFNYPFGGEQLGK
ncbi:ATP-NAD kinase-like domain-containing protein [Xylogone sp. PMI_703]|nr:ATP-NAD kinase-like domain-containing protein [Xylogone sp. PMI_703]